MPLSVDNLKGHSTQLNPANRNGMHTFRRKRGFIAKSSWSYLVVSFVAAIVGGLFAFLRDLRLLSEKQGVMLETGLTELVAPFEWSPGEEYEAAGIFLAPLPRSLLTCRREYPYSENGNASVQRQSLCSYYRPLQFFQEGMPGYPYRQLLDSAAEWDIVPYWEQVSWGGDRNGNGDGRRIPGLSADVSITYLNIPKSGSTTMTKALKHFARVSGGRFRTGGGCCHGRPASAIRGRSGNPEMEFELRDLLKDILSSQEGHEEAKQEWRKIATRDQGHDATVPSPRNFLFTIIRDPVSRFVSSTRHVLLLRRSARGKFGVKLQRACGCDWHRFGSWTRNVPSDRERLTMRRRESGPRQRRALTARNTVTRTNRTSSEVFRCVISFLKEHGPDVDVHFQPSATRINGQYIQGVNVSVAVFTMEYLQEILTAMRFDPKRVEKALGHGPNSVWSSMSQRERKLFDSLSTSDLDDHLITEVCEIYRVDVELWHYLGFSVPFCDGRKVGSNATN